MKNLYICFVVCALMLLTASCGNPEDAVTFSVLDPKTGTPVVDVLFHHERPNTFFTKLLNPIAATYHSHQRVTEVNVNERGEAIFSKMPTNAYFITAGPYYNSKMEIVKLLSKTERSLDVVIKTKWKTKKMTVPLKDSFRMGCPSEEYFYYDFWFSIPDET